MGKIDFMLISRTSLAALAVLYFLGFCGPTWADDLQNLEFTGILITPPPCNIDDDSTIQVDFGDKVGIRKVATGIYRENVPLNLHCEENSNAWQLQLSVIGNQAAFDVDNATVVTPEQADLGIKLYLGGSPFELGKPVLINSATPLAIDAVLVQRDGISLEEGEFTALATLRVEYQ